MADNTTLNLNDVLDGQPYVVSEVSRTQDLNLNVVLDGQPFVNSLPSSTPSAATPSVLISLIIG